MWTAALCATRTMPALLALIVAVLLGAFVYAVGIRLMRCLDPADARPLSSFGRAVPQPLRPWFEQLVSLVARS